MRFTLLWFTFFLWMTIGSASTLKDSAMVAELKAADELIVKEDFPNAYQIYKAILPYFDKQEDWYHASYIRLWMGECIYYEGRYQEALNLSLKADEIAQENFNTDTLNYYSTLLQNIGVFYSALGNFDKQMQYYQKLHQHALKFHGSESKQAADAYFSLGAAFGRRGQWDRFLSYLDTSLQIAKHLDYTEGIASAYINLALAYGVKEDYYKAIEFQKEALALTDSKEEIARGYNNLGMFYMDVEDYELAKTYLSKALVLRQELYPPLHDNISSTLLNLCRIHFEAGAINKANTFLDQAIANLEQAEKENKSYLKFAYNYKSAVLLKLNNALESEKYARKGLNLSSGRQLFDANSSMSLANALLVQAKYSEALTQIQLAIDRIRNPQNGKLENIYLALDFLELKTRILYEKGQKEKDLNELKTALETVLLTDTLIFQARNTYQNRSSKKVLAKNAHEFYATAIAITYELYHHTNAENYLELAFEFAEKNKSMFVSEKLNDLYAKSFAGIPKKVLGKEKKLLQEIEFYSNLLEEAKLYKNEEDIAKWEPVLFEKRRAQEDLLFQMEQQYPKYYELKYQLKIPSLDLVISELLKPNEVLIEYFLAEEVLYVILLSREEKSFYRLQVGEDFIEIVNQFRQAIYHQEVNYGTLAFAIYQKILQPLESKIFNQNLLIIPDGIIGLLPFEALLSEEIVTNENTNYKTLPYLLRQYQFRYYFSAGVAFRGLAYQKNQDRRKGILAIAPTFENQNELNAIPDSLHRQIYSELGNLEGAWQEVNFLKSHYDGKFLFGADANEAVFKKLGGRFQILHIATHALIDNQLPTASKLALSPDSNTKEDGFLNVFELYNMELFADLAVLSACNTGSGQVTKGDGVASLARAFAYAGCPNLLMSLWKVKDKTTPQIINPYYQGLEKGLDKSEALHTAKLTYINQSHSLMAHPYYWSGFIYVGDRDTLILNTKSKRLFWYLLGLTIIGCLFFWRFKSITPSS